MSQVEIGDQVYIENAGDFEVKAEAVKAVHDGKVLLAIDKLDSAMRTAIARAHQQEQRESPSLIRRSRC